MFGTKRARPDWSTLGQDWPNADASRFLRVGAINWHVQVSGPEGAPAMLLLHGTGASAHSFRDIIPRLTPKFRIIAPDLPGHGFTDSRTDRALSLPGMAKALTNLCDVLQIAPRFGVGHSAGAAVLFRMAMAENRAFERIIGINSALSPIEGNAVFSPLAKLLFSNSLIPKLFASRAASGDTVKSLLARTGSPLDAEGIRLYQALACNTAHVAGALGMMANWDLEGMKQSFGGYEGAVTLITAQDDPMVPPTDSRDAFSRLQNAQLLERPAGGHLVHEQEPAEIADILIKNCTQAAL